jgi:glycosyltransferase involved in cell wall biosynthesis
MKKKLAIINSGSKECTYGGVAPIMRNMHKFFVETFDVQYFYLPDSWKCGLGRFNLMLYLFFQRNKLKQFDFTLSHVPEGSYVISFLKIPYAHIYHGNHNPMTQSRYWFGKYFAFVFDIFYKRIEKTSVLKYTVGPVWGDKKKLFNPISHQVVEKPYDKRAGFIFAGRFDLIKNIDRLITIYSQLPKNIQDENHFYIAGFGGQEDNLRNIVQKLKLNDKIHFLGNLPNQKVIEEDSTKKILIMASTQEGLPTAIAEALSVGIPVVSTNSGDIGLVIKNNYNGFIFPLDFSDSDYIDAILKILTDYERFAHNAKASASVFDGEIITKAVIQDINNIILKHE